MTHRTCLCLILIACASVAPAAEFADHVKPVLTQKCMKCHCDDEANGEVNFQRIATAEQFLAAPELIERMIEAIGANDMPPEGEPPFDPNTRSELLAVLKTMLQAATPLQAAQRAPLHRLNRFQYNNSVKDLFQLNRDVFPLSEKLMTRYDDYLHAPTGRMPDQVNVASHSLNPKPGLEGVKAFPKDLRASHGFDNQSDQLTLSPLLLDAFLRLSVSIVESPDFNDQNVGIWDQFFREPPADTDRSAEIQRRLKPFMKVAFRRSVADETLERYVRYAESKLDEGLSFPDSMKKVASAILSSPMFLYRFAAADGDQRLFELASRLSFFLWGSCPDLELLELADSGELAKPEVLNKTIERMFSDPKIERFLDAFPSQWMQLENVLAATPDPQKDRFFYLDKDNPASLQMVIEPLLLFDAVFVENRPIIELVAPKFSFHSDFLRTWYVSDAQRMEEDLRKKLRSRTFSRVAASDARYGGVITNAAVLSMTSGPNRTHPVARGAWIIEVIFNDPPPPPPNNVPPLDEDDGAKDLTIREKFAAHRDNPSCAACHVKLDPLGFALENFDITGRWRDKYENGREVDASGTLLRKYDFDGVVQFKEALIKEDRRFAKAFTEHLLRFALARELGPSDSNTVEAIVNQTESEDFKLRSLLRAVVFSDLFLQSPTEFEPVIPTDGVAIPRIR